MNDAMADRTMTAGEAKSLLREAVKLNIQHARTGREVSPLSVERDTIAADLAAAGHPADFANYSHPMDVE